MKSWAKAFKMNTFDILFKPDLIKNFEKCGIAFLDAPSEVFKAALFILEKIPIQKIHQITEARLMSF